MAKPRIRDLEATLNMKIIGDPTGMEPPNLRIMVGNLRDVLLNPRSFTPRWIELYKQDLEEAKKAVAAIEEVLPHVEKRIQERQQRGKRR